MLLKYVQERYGILTRGWKQSSNPEDGSGRWMGMGIRRKEFNSKLEDRVCWTYLIPGWEKGNSVREKMNSKIVSGGGWLDGWGAGKEFKWAGGRRGEDVFERWKSEVFNGVVLVLLSPGDRESCVPFVSSLGLTASAETSDAVGRSLEKEPRGQVHILYRPIRNFST